MTLIRMIIGLSQYCDNPIVNSGDTMIVGSAIGMFSDEAISSSTFPNAAAQEDVALTGWMWKAQTVVTESGTANNNALRLDADIRSQRKLMYGRPVLLINNIPDIGGPFNVKTRGVIRCLYLLD